MFKNYNKYLENYINYLKTINAQINVSDMENGLESVEMLILAVYGNVLNHKYSARYSEKLNKIVFTEPSIEWEEKAKELRLKKLSEYMVREFSYLDTLNQIGTYTIFDGATFIFTDYGLIKMYGRETEGNETAKITTIEIWVWDKSHKDEIESFINTSLVDIPHKEVQQNLTVCTYGPYGMKKSKIEMKPFDCDISKNYNDDIPYKKLTELINSEEEELILLHGEAGTGKTSIIKKLILDNKDIDFVYFDFNLLTSFSDSKVFEFLSEHKNHVLIIEDCEKLFTNRNNGNKFLNSMLNLTDGIIGEAFNIKFLCTFNCPPNKIDDAVMRKGRLSLIYEFKKLTLEKTKALLPTATEPMTLAQIYNTESNGKDKEDKKIGF